MPFEWVKKTTEAPALPGAFSHADTGPLTNPEQEPVLEELHLWPYRSLPKRGFVLVVGATAALLLLPLFAVLGTLVLWGLLPFLVAAVALLYAGLMRSYRDGQVLEELTIRHHRVDLHRHNPRSPDQHWHANPHWVQVELHETSGPVPHYVTLRGEGRTVEIGAFLSADERMTLYRELSRRLPTGRG